LKQQEGCTLCTNAQTPLKPEVGLSKKERQVVGLGTYKNPAGSQQSLLRIKGDASVARGLI